MMTWEQAVLWLRAQPDQKDLVRNCFYDDPIEAAAERYYKSGEWAEVRARLAGRRGRALDVGAGRGISSYALSRDGWQVTALEPDPSDVVGAGAIRRLAQSAGLDIVVEQTFGETLPFPDASFDLVYCRAVLHHARDLRLLCAEAARVLAPNGLMLATREHVISRPSDMQAFLDGHPLHRLYGGESAYLLAQYTDAIRRAGLRLDDVLNAFDSDINLFPSTRETVRRQAAKKLRLPSPTLVPDVLLSLLARFSNAPGRLYTFVATKAYATPLAVRQ